MNIKTGSLLLATGLFAVGFGFAAPVGQSSSQSESSSQSSTSAQKTSRWHHKGMVGTVKAYDPGESLEISTSKGKTKTFDLKGQNTKVNGAENVQVGQMVRVREQRENGQKTITIEPYTSARNRATMSTDNTGAMPGHHTYVGTVAEYKPGESLELNTRRGQKKTFDLDEKNVTVKGAENVRNGERVKVTERQENGRTVIDIMPYSHKTRSNGTMGGTGTTSGTQTNS